MNLICPYHTHEGRDQDGVKPKDRNKDLTDWQKQHLLGLEPEPAKHSPIDIIPRVGIYVIKINNQHQIIWRLKSTNARSQSIPALRRAASRTVLRYLFI